jgi:soluble lytic murein transglycosylase-like protein
MLKAILALIIFHTVATTTSYVEPVKPFTALEAPFTPTVTSKIDIVAISTATTTLDKLKERIATLSEKYGVNPELATAIIKSESNFNRYAKNASSSAEGYWQFLDSTYQMTMEAMNLPTTTSKFDDEISLEAGFFLLKKDGVIHWKASEPIWLKML